jgi:hypothetical protein
MKRFTAKIVDMMKQEKLYASQGGPIILSQVIFQIFYAIAVSHLDSNLMGPRRSEIELLVVEGYSFLCQIENEYGNIDSAYGSAAKSYISWAASMATSLDTGVPWVMCQQADAPDPIVSFLIYLAWQFTGLVRNLS